MIKQLNQESILHISTSSTLQSLASFVKELIENSIDAQSTQIIVNFFNNGKEGFEVIDNGIGISTINQKQLATRGGTSKIQNFEDLEFVLTHGFRGEALNSIATLSNVTIISKHKDEELGWKWEIPQEPTKIARQTGTSIKVENIFYTLPVRAQEFKKNYKIEYNKAINILTEYAIINTNIEFKIYNEEEKNKKKLVLDSGLENQNMKQRITNVLGESNKILHQMAF
ncbi:unnamed protein product [Paramecium primaurelia]|uniref:Uncharacterized protein n=1 Tax=Paramecium primaurelia TaxID=5886 RepID=A0A8S1P6F0_PARPR|nr:unnamed protein product [Paramecium primaurelia]